MPKLKPALELDGRTGEGGGQVVRIASALAAVTTQPIRITHVRGGRPRGGGLKAQHVSSLKWLATATGATVTDLAVGSQSFEFRPTRGPTTLVERNFLIEAGAPASSTMLILQAILPFLIFAAGDPIDLEIRGGTNVSFSPSWEYLDQVLLPTLEDWFGLHVERQLLKRGWSVGPSGQKGGVKFRVYPLGAGQKLQLRAGSCDDSSLSSSSSSPSSEVSRIDASIIAPSALHAPLQEELVKDLAREFPDVDVHFVLTEDGGHEARIYVLLVAHSPPSKNTTGRHLRWGRDWLYDRSRKKKTFQQIGSEISRKVSRDLRNEVRRGVVDEYLQDQLVVFQALAEGRTSFPRSHAGAEKEEGNAGGLEDKEMEGDGDNGDVQLLDELELREGGKERMRKDKKTSEPFGEGSTHTTTARWVAAEMLPQVMWYNGGRVCEGAGVALG